MNEIILSDAFEQLKEEVARLQVILSGLIQEKDDLELHICPELQAEYNEKIGSLNSRILYQRLMVEELKRRISIVQAAINREEQVSREQVDETIDKEYKEYKEKVDEQFRQSEEEGKRYREQKKKEREYEERFNKRQEYEEQQKNARDPEADSDKNTSSESGNDNDENTTDSSSDYRNEFHRDNDEDINKAPHDEFEGMDFKLRIKEIYHRIVKKLHPDMNPDITEHEKELWNKTQKAYQEGDLETLEAIYDEIFGVEADDIPETEEGIEKLVKMKERLLKQIEEIKVAIREIKSVFPYTEKEFLDDDEAVAQKQAELNDVIDEYEKLINELNERLETLDKEMEKLRRG